MTRADRGRAPASSRGFTVVEVLVAMTIVALVAPFLMGGLISSVTRARQGQDRGMTTAWAQAEIDVLRARCFERLTPEARKVTSATLQPGEPELPDGFAAGFIRLEPAEPASLKATVSLYRRDWSGARPPGPPYFTTTTYIADIRVAGACP